MGTAATRGDGLKEVACAFGVRSGCGEAAQDAENRQTLVKRKRQPIYICKKNYAASHGVQITAMSDVGCVGIVWSWRSIAYYTTGTSYNV